jgi:hypothetical protein
MALEEGYAFVSPRTPDTARALLAAAEAIGVESWNVRTTTGGYYVPVAVSKRYEQSLSEPVVEAEPEGPSVPDESWKVADLKAFAQDNEVDLGDATKKADILAVIRSADKEE